MAITTWSEFDDTAYVNMASPVTCTLSAASQALTLPTTSLAFTSSRAARSINLSLGRAGLYKGSTCLAVMFTNTSGYVSYGTYAPVTWYNGYTVTTSDFFNTSNPTQNTVALTINSIADDTYLDVTDYDYTWEALPRDEYGHTLSVINVVLDAPPTCSSTQVSFTNASGGQAYAGISGAKVTISSPSAKYGGSISSVVLKIGDQTSASRTTNGDLTISTLNQEGTFTPTVVVTDSRGQVTNILLNNITVNGYASPTVSSFNAERTASTGVPDDEGTYVTIDPSFTFTSAVATLTAPTVAVVDDTGATKSATVTWYSTRASNGSLSGSVTWSSVTSGRTVYARISISGGFNTQKSYQISVTPKDTKSTGTTKTQVVGAAFYTVDFLAGGHGIAFGQPASAEGFVCNMDATFKQDLVAQDMTAQEVEDFVDSLVIGR